MALVMLLVAAQAVCPPGGMVTHQHWIIDHGLGARKTARAHKTSGGTLEISVAVHTIPPNQVRLIGSTGLDSGLVLAERSVKEWVGVLRDSACGLLRTVLHTR